MSLLFAKLVKCIIYHWWLQLKSRIFLIIIRCEVKRIAELKANINKKVISAS
ncbi:UNVERIFIED_CONTAM: hypothetical protein NCL1_29843 [Trichonephila clavipes]